MSDIGALAAGSFSVFAGAKRMKAAQGGAAAIVNLGGELGCGRELLPRGTGEGKPG